MAEGTPLNDPPGQPTYLGVVFLQPGETQHQWSTWGGDDAEPDLLALVSESAVEFRAECSRK